MGVEQTLISFVRVRFSALPRLKKVGGSCEDRFFQSACFCFVVQALWLWQKPDVRRALRHVKKSYWYKLVGLFKRSASKWATDCFSTAVTAEKTGLVLLEKQKTRNYTIDTIPVNSRSFYYSNLPKGATRYVEATVLEVTGPDCG